MIWVTTARLKAIDFEISRWEGVHQDESKVLGDLARALGSRAEAPVQAASPES